MTDISHTNAQKLAETMVALLSASREKLSIMIDTWAETPPGSDDEIAAERARALIKPDARAALDSLLAAEVRKALEGAIEAVQTTVPYGNVCGDLMRFREIGYKDAIFDAKSAIRAMIEEEAK